MADPTDTDGFPEYLPIIPDVADDVNEQYRLIARRNSNNKNVLEEKIQSNQTLKDTRDLKIPTGIPAMYLLAQQSVNEMGRRRQVMPEINGSWKDQHVAMSEDPAEVTTYIIAGDHLLYFTAHGLLPAQASPTDPLRRGAESGSRGPSRSRSDGLLGRVCQPRASQHPLPDGRPGQLVQELQPRSGRQLGRRSIAGHLSARAEPEQFGRDRDHHPKLAAPRWSGPVRALDLDQ